MTAASSTHPSGRPRASRGGFTLIEVMIAVLLIGITFGVVFQAFSQSQRNIDKMDRHQTALQMAQNKMNELIVDFDVVLGKTIEDRKDDDYQWKIELVPREVDDLTVQKNQLTVRLLDIRLTLYYKVGGATREMKLFCSKLVPRPKIGEKGYLPQK